MSDKAIQFVRNFWISLDVDGRLAIDTGPRAADGGFQLTIRMRDNAGVSHALTVHGICDDNDLRLEVHDPAIFLEPTIVYSRTTRR